MQQVSVYFNEKILPLQFSGDMEQDVVFFLFFFCYSVPSLRFLSFRHVYS